MGIDALLLVHVIKSSRYDLSFNGVLFREIKAFASLYFSHFQVEYCPRACNTVADALVLFGSMMELAPPAV